MWKAIAVLPAAAALASCLSAAPGAPQRVVDTRQAMVAGINSAAVAIWDIAHEAQGESGELDPALMSDEAWSRLTEEGETLERWSRLMAEADVIHAAGPDRPGRTVPEGAASQAEIQAMIDANPEGFRAQARDLAERAGLLVAAARARDFAAAGHRANEIDVPCQGCHTRYWYQRDTQQLDERRPRA